MRSTKSFTLIELLIVIGILAVLVAAIVITLNPAQLLAQARDSKRQQDLSALTQALHTITTLDQSLFMGTSSIVYTSLPDATTTCANWNLPSLPTGWQYYCVATSSLQNTNGTGWIPVNFKTTGVVSLSSLPTDPINASSSNLYYTYVSGGSFQLASHFESAKYQATQGSDAMYTVGSNLNLAPFLSGLVGWWKFDDNTNDSSGYANNGTENGGTPTYILGEQGQARSFDGIDDYVVMANSAALQSFDGTVSFFMNGVACTLCGVVGKASSPTWAGSSWLFQFWSAHNIKFGLNGQDIYVGAPANSSPDNTWHHITGTWQRSGDQTTIKLYLDGTLQSSSSSVITLRTGNGIVVGSWGPGTSYISDVIVDDVRIYNRALSSSEVQALYNATK